MKRACSNAVTLLSLLLLLGAAAPPLEAQSVTVFASGLDGPRGLKFGPDGALYVAEAGRGGTNVASNCEQVPAPVGPYHGGPSARISKITPQGHISTVVDGLPSGKSSLPSGDTVGVADLAFVGSRLFALFAGGGCSHGNPEAPNGVIEVDIDHGTWSYIADLSAFLKAIPIANPGPSLDDWEPDGTWYGMVAVRGNLYATEPNHQQIVSISPITAKINRIVDVSGSSETWVGPTGITYHGDLFFGNLAPFPITQGSADVFKLTQSGNFKVWNAGLTTVVGVAFDNRDRLYVLELSDAPGFPNPGSGKLVRISPSGAAEDIVTGLVVPYGNGHRPGWCNLHFEFWRGPARPGPNSKSGNYRLGFRGCLGAAPL
jgi:hypothetical protein